MRLFSRLSLPILTALFLNISFLGIVAEPASADNTGFLSLINSYRQENGLGPLAEDQKLTDAACWFAADMGAKNYFPSNHVDSLGRTMSQRLTDFGVTGSKAENIYYTTAGSSANSAFSAWKNSPGHNNNMLSSTYTRIGIGRANYSGKWYWVTDFANGSINSLSNQCGSATATNNTNTPSLSTKKPQPNSPSNSTESTPVTPKLEVKVATSTPNEAMQGNLATVAATVSPKIVQLNKSVGERLENPNLVQGVTGSSLVLINFFLIGYIFFKLSKFLTFRKNF